MAILADIARSRRAQEIEPVPVGRQCLPLAIRRIVAVETCGQQIGRHCRNDVAYALRTTDPISKLRHLSMIHDASSGFACGAMPGTPRARSAQCSQASNLAASCRTA